VPTLLDHPQPSARRVWGTNGDLISGEPLDPAKRDAAELCDIDLDAKREERRQQRLLENEMLWAEYEAEVQSGAPSAAARKATARFTRAFSAYAGPARRELAARRRCARPRPVERRRRRGPRARRTARTSRRSSRSSGPPEPDPDPPALAPAQAGTLTQLGEVLA
jgi:hypothetical protein